MHVPHSLESLVEIGVIEDVVRPLMSGKEAQLYLVVSGGEERVAKVYKEASQRSFQRKSNYTDGRAVRNSRDRRAMRKGTRHGRSRDEAGWRSAEVDAIYRLRDAGVRVPIPNNYMDGVLIMELIRGDDGLPAPRLGELTFSRDAAQDVYDHLIQEVIRMLCAGLVHGDLSDFNVLMGADGPVVIDFPQAVDAASNAGARKLLLRDVDNLHRFLGRVVSRTPPPYAQEMWDLFERNELRPDTQLSGGFRDKRGKANTRDVLDIIGDAERDEQRRRQRLGQERGPRGGKRGKRGGGQATSAAGPRGPKVEVLVRSDGRTRTVQPGVPPPPRPNKKPAGEGTTGEADAPKKRRRRRRRRGPGAGPTGTGRGGGASTA